MSWLPGLSEVTRDRWKEQASTRIRFLQLFSARAREPRLSGEPEETSSLAAASALTKAAEIALATDQTSRGRELLAGAVEILLDAPRWPTARTALLGALAGRVDTVLYQSGIILRDTQRNMSVSTSWFAPAVTWQKTAGSMIAAALVSGEPDRTLSLLTEPGSRDAQHPFSLLIASNTMEAETLPAFGLRRRPNGGWNVDQRGDRERSEAALVGFAALHQRYAARLRFLASDRAHWDALQLRAPLIDWTLLALHVALLRRSTIISASDIEAISGKAGPFAALTRFFAELAKEIA